jgi:hypothetical protein
MVYLPFFFGFLPVPTRCGSALIMAFIASSNDNGWSEIGFAFGMGKPSNGKRI